MNKRYTMLKNLVEDFKLILRNIISDLVDSKRETLEQGKSVQLQAWTLSFQEELYGSFRSELYFCGKKPVCLAQVQVDFIKIVIQYSNLYEGNKCRISKINILFMYHLFNEINVIYPLSGNMLAVSFYFLPFTNTENLSVEIFVTLPVKFLCFYIVIPYKRYQFNLCNHFTISNSTQSNLKFNRSVFFQILKKLLLNNS